MQRGHCVVTAAHFYSQDRNYLFALQDNLTEWRRREREPGVYVEKVWIPGNFLAEGSFVVEAALSSHYPATSVHLVEREAVGFDVFDPMTGDTARGDYKGAMQGFIRPVFDWEIEFHAKK